MRARLRDVPVGTRFCTTITGRGGVVRAQNGPETRVVFDDRIQLAHAAGLSPEEGLAREVVVEAEEVAH